MKKVKRSALINKLDKLISIEVRKQGYCDWCRQRKDTLQCAHIISRTFTATRFDLENCLCLCSGCHLKWHKEPIEATRFLESRWSGRYDRLNAKRNSGRKVTTLELEELYQQLRSSQV